MHWDKWWHQKQCGMRGTLDISSRSYNKGSPTQHTNMSERATNWNIQRWVNGGEQGREGRNADMESIGRSLEWTTVLGEERIETAGVLFVAPTILPEGSAYSMAEPSNQGRDLGAKTEYRSKTALPGIKQSHRACPPPHNLPVLICPATSQSPRGPQKKMVSVSD